MSVILYVHVHAFTTEEAVCLTELKLVGEVTTDTLNYFPYWFHEVWLLYSRLFFPAEAVGVL